MPRKDADQFIRERLEALDPLRDTSSGSRADTEVVQPILKFFGVDAFQTDARSLVLDTLRNVHPELGVRPDGVLDDALGKPFATLVHGIVREIMLLKGRRKPDPRIHTLESAADLLGALFVPLNEGGKAFGKFRFFYAAPLTEIIRPENIVIVGNGMRFTPTEVQTIAQAEMQLNYEDGRYYFDVDTIATTPGKSGNIAPRTSSRCPSVVRSVGVTNTRLFTGGDEPDTVSSFLAKARNYPTQLSLSVARGIRAILANEFGGSIRRVEIVGMGDADMLRDVIKGGNYGPSIVFNVNGYALPSFTNELKSNLFGAPVAMPASIGSGELVDDYYLIVHTIDAPGTLSEGRIKVVHSTVSPCLLELDEAIVPFINQERLVWEIRHRRLTLSEVPGGFLLPPLGGEVEIKDDEIHVGGCTDIYALSEAETNTSDIEVASDEDELASGSAAVAGGVTGWADPKGWVRLDTTDKVLLDGEIDEIFLNGLGNPLGASFTGVLRGTSDVSEIQISPGILGVLGAGPHSDILEILISGNWTRFRLESLTSEGITGSKLIFWVERNIPGLALPVPARIVRPSPEGIEAGRTMLVIQRDPQELYRVVEWSNGFYQGTSTDPGNYRAEVRVYPLPDTGSTYPVNEAWSLVDDVDIDLSDPKRLRASGSDLAATAGSNVVTTVIARNMEEQGVKKDDVLRILTGADAGDHTIAEDPSGPGKSILHLEDRLTASGTFAYEIFAPQTPINLPLVDVRSATLLDVSAGTTGSIVPLGMPLGATSSQFSNAGTGLKWRRTDCTVGILGLVPFTSWVFTPAVDNYLELVVYSQGWGYIHKKIDSGGPWDLATAAGVRAFLAAANQELPADYFFAVRPDGSIPDLTTITSGEDLYLAVAPYDSDESTAVPGAMLASVGANATRFLNTGGTSALVTSRSVTFMNLDDTFFVDRMGISAWNDVVLVENGLNETKASPVLSFASTFGNLHVVLFPWVRLLPQRQATARIGSPSIGLGRTFFRDPTLFEVDQDTRYKSGDLSFMPDPRLLAIKTPGYPDTEKPAGLIYISGGAKPEFRLPDYFAKYNIGPLDFIEAGCRDMWFLWDFVADGEWDPGAGTYNFVFAFDNASSLTVTIVVPAATTYTRDQLKTIFNAVLSPDPTGPQMAIDVDIGAAEFLGISTQSRITSVTGNGVTEMSDMEPTTFATLGNLSYLAQKNKRFCVMTLLFTETTDFYADGAVLAPPYETAAVTNVQFTVLGLGQQRFPAKKMAENVHASGLYYADVELMALGAGDEWNLPPDQSFELSAWRCLGYVLHPDNDVLSFSTRETPILSSSPYIQDPAVSDGYDSQTGVYGSGLRLEYDRDPAVSALQQLADSADERENNESVLARCVRPCEVFLTVEYSGGLAEDEMRTEIEKLIEVQEESLDVSEIIYRLQQLGATAVQLPVEIGAAYARQDRSYNLVMAKDHVTVTRLAAFLIGRLTLRRLG